MKYLTVQLVNGEEFGVKGESINDVPMSVNGSGWSAFEIVNGKLLQVRSESIVAIYEREEEF